MPVLTDEDVGLGAKELSDADVGLAPEPAAANPYPAITPIEETLRQRHEFRASQRDEAAKDVDRATSLYGLANAAETGVDILARTRPDLVARQTLGLASKGVGKLVDLIPGMPKTPENAPDLTQQPILSPEQITGALRKVLVPQTDIAEGILKAGGELGSALTDPATAMLMGPVTKAPALARPLFGLPMVASIPEAVERVKQAKDTPELVAASLGLAAQVGLPAGIERGLNGKRTVIPPDAPIYGDVLPMERATPKQKAKPETVPTAEPSLPIGREPAPVTSATLNRLAQEAQQPEAVQPARPAQPAPTASTIESVVDEMVRNGERVTPIAKRLSEMGFDREAILKTIQDRITPNFGNPELDAAIKEPTPPAESKAAEPPKESETVKPSEAAKEPWQMGRNEFVRVNKAINAEWQKTKQGPSKFADFKTTRDYQDYMDQTRERAIPMSYEEAMHRSEIKEALRLGKPVPDFVLNDYPDLKPPTAKEKAPTQEPVSEHEETVVNAPEKVNTPPAEAKAEEVAKEGDPNIGRTWNSKYGKQEIVRKEEWGGQEHYYAKDEKGAERVYSANRLEETIKRDEHELTPEYAKEKAEADAALAERQARDARFKARQEQAEAEIGEFTKGQSPMAAGKTKAALLKQTNSNGIIRTRKELIESEVAKGAKVITENGQRRLEKPDGSFWEEKTITKAAMDYADYLTKKAKPPEQPAPAAKAQGEAPNKWIAVATSSHRQVKRLHDAVKPEGGGLPVAMDSKTRAWKLEDTPENRAIAQRLGLPIRARETKFYNELEQRSQETRAKLAAEQPPPEPPKAGAEGISVGPGSASPEDVGSTKSDMQQLAESMQNVASPKLTMEDRLAAAKKAVQTLKTEGPKTIGEKVRNGVERLSATASAIKTGLTKLPAWTNFKRILGQWDGANQIADHELRDFVKTINRNIREDRQVAITNWIQAGGDAAVLRERAAASKTAKLRKGYEDALTLNKDEITAARNIESYLESRLQAGIDSGILDHGLDNYVTQIWKRPNPATQKLVSDIAIGKLQPNFRYARQRLLESYFQGEQIGFTPANKKVSALIAAYDQSFNRAIAARGFIKNLTKGTASDGRPLVEVSGSGRLVGADEANPEAMLIKPKSKSEEISDYRSVDHPALRKWKWAGKTPEGTPVLLEGQLLVHPEIYTHLRNILGRSAWRQYAVPRAILGLERGIKELMFSASGFHQVQETLHALGHRVNPMNMEKVDFSQPWQKEAVEHGLETGSYNAMENFSEGLASGPLVSKIPILGKRILGPYTEWLFQDWIPRLKMTMYKHALERNLERYKGEMDAGKITRDQVVENTAKQANSAFGELNYNWIGRNKSLQDALRAFLIAPDFLEARAKFVGEAIKPYGREQLVALGLLAATQYITARLINQQMDDDPHWEIQNAFKFIVGKHSYELRSVPGDIVHLISDPKKFSVARISPLLRSTIEGITGRDYRGVKRDAMEQLKDFAKLPTPISIRQQDDRRWWESFLNAFGVHERSYTAGQEIGELARAYREKVKGKPSVEVIESEDSPYRKLRVAIDYGNEKAAQKAIQDLRKDHTDAQIFQSMRQSLTHPFTGMKQSDEAKFRSSLEPVQAERYKEAQAERQERFKKFTALWARRGKK